MSIESHWTQLESWLSGHHPELLSWLNPGATEKQIHEAEQVIGVRLPEDVRRCYSRHNGQKSTCPPFFSGEEFLSLESMVMEWRVWKGLLDDGTFTDDRSASDDRLQPEWWHPGWIPFTTDHTGNNICIDLAPGSAGTLGQVIHMFHDDDVRPVLASSLDEWLGTFVAQIHADEYVLAKEYGFLVPRVDVESVSEVSKGLMDRFRTWLFRY
jgi:cell wall assembly regulator SMI1